MWSVGNLLLILIHCAACSVVLCVGRGEVASGAHTHWHVVLEHLLPVVVQMTHLGKHIMCVYVCVCVCTCVCIQYGMCCHLNKHTCMAVSSTQLEPILGSKTHSVSLTYIPWTPFRCLNTPSTSKMSFPLFNSLLYLHIHHRAVCHLLTC